MIIRRVPVLSLALLFMLAIIVRGQDGDDSRIIEEDYRVKSVEDRQRAVVNLLRSVDDSRKLGRLIEAASTLNRVGRFQIRMSVPEDAVATFQEALKLLDQQSDIKTRIDGLNGLASSYDYLSKCDLAEPHAEQAIALSKQNNYVAGQAEALLTLSDCQNHRDHSLALMSAQESLELWRSIDRKRGMAEALKVIGHDQILQNNLMECSQSMEAALDLYRELNDLEEQASVLIYLAKVEHQKGAYQNALALYTRVQSMIDEQAEPYKMGQIAYGLGDAFLEIGLPDIALKKFNEGLGHFRKTKNQRAVSILYWSIGRAHYFLGHHQEALENLEVARKAAESDRDVTLTAFCDDFLGRTQFSTGEPTKALGRFQSALAGYSSAKNTMEVARTKALIGQVYQQQGGFEKAKSSYQGALKTFRTLSDRVNESATLYALGGLELELNNLDEAEDYLRHSIEVTEDMRRVSTSSDLAAAFSATVHDRYEAYIECLMRKHHAQPDRGFAALALETSELARARSLGEILRSTATGFAPGVDPQLVAQEKSLRQSLRVKEDSRVRLLGGDYKREDLASLEADLVRLEKEYKQVTETIRAHYPAFEKLTRPGAWTLGEIQSQVIADDQTVLLEYSLGTDKSYVWAVTHDGFKSYELPSQREINAAAGIVYELLATEPNAETENKLAQATHGLSEMVLSPVASELNKARIIVVADGALNYIPFQLLPAPSTPGQQLVASYEVVNAPSASVLGQLRQETSRRQRPANVLAAFGDPVFPSNFAQQGDRDAGAQLSGAPTENYSLHKVSRDIQAAGDSFDPAKLEQLFFSKLELANLRAVAGRNTLLATRFEATPDNLRTTDLTKYSILHLATHGILDPKRPERSGLVLSTVNSKGQHQNGFVGLQDIYSLRAPVDLVVLSACRTGLGKDVRGEGLIGLTRGFIYAGASSVVASLWKVDDEATAELMKRFYVNMLQHGMRPAAALRAAQNSIRLEPQWRAPYYWAAFTLQGEYLQTIKSPVGGARNYQRFLAGGYCLVVLAAGIWWYFRRRLIQS